MPKTGGPDPRYTWRRTNPETPDHFAGLDGEWPVLHLCCNGYCRYAEAYGKGVRGLL